MAEPGRPLRILVRSDSQGTSLDEGTVDPHDERLWAAALARLLAARSIDAEVRNASAAGLKIDGALRSQRTDPLVQEATEWADVVIVGLGINDWWPIARPQWLADWMDRARPLLLRRAMRRGYQKVRHRMLVLTKGRIRPTKPAVGRAALTALVRELQGASREVVLLTPLPVRSPINPLLDGNTYEACDMVCEVGADTGVPTVDCRTLFPPIAWETISIDHLHANPAGQELIAASVAEVLPILVPDERSHRERVDGGVLVRGDATVAHSLSSIDDHWHVALVRGFSVHDEMWRVQHDPLVREAVAAAGTILLAPGGASRPTAWDRERLDQLVDILRRKTTLVLADDGGRWSPAITAVVARYGLTVVSLSHPENVRLALSNP